MIQYFVNQKKHKATGVWDNGIVVKENVNQAKHQFHAFMSTYGYDQDATIDFVSCSVTDTYGGVVIPEEIDNRMPET